MNKVRTVLLDYLFIYREWYNGIFSCGILLTHICDCCRYIGLKNKIQNVILPQLESGKAKRLLTFNEPDGELQSNLALEKVIHMWPHFAQTSYHLGSPATVHGDNEWMKGFMSAVEKQQLRLDFICVHWYGPADAAQFKKKITHIYQMYGKRYPLLVTEFATADWSARSMEANQYSHHQVLAFMKQVLPWLEATPWIMGYAWFPFDKTLPVGTSSALFECDGSLTTLGRLYASVTTENPHGDTSIGLAESNASNCKPHKVAASSHHDEVKQEDHGGFTCNVCFSVLS
jgi:hypothetical protein